MTYHHHHGFDGCEYCEGRHGLWGTFALGLGVFAVGVTLILDNFGLFDAGGLAPYWPLLLVLVGASHLVAPTTIRRSGWGLSWIAVGAIMLLHNLGAIAVGIEVLWPVALVILGVSVLLGYALRRLQSAGDGARRGSEPTV